MFWDTQFSDTGKRETVENFTETGFKKSKMPAEMYAKILDHYDKTPDVYVTCHIFVLRMTVTTALILCLTVTFGAFLSPASYESHVTGYINNKQHGAQDAVRKPGWKESVTFFRELGPEMRQYILEVMQPLLEEWAGGTELVYTSIYGMRGYSNGSMLQTHCDRIDTHVISAILNIKQEGVEEPWPLSIMGQDGQTHEVLMEPGDMVFYESARMAHGRPRMFLGERYVNAFVHTKPAGGGWPKSIRKTKMLQSSHSHTRRQGHKVYQSLLHEEM